MPIVFWASLEPWRRPCSRPRRPGAAGSAGERPARGAPEDPGQGDHEREGADEAEERRGDQRHQDLVPDALGTLSALDAGRDDRRADQAADQGVAAGAGDARTTR